MEKFKGEWNWIAFIEFFIYHEVQNLLDFRFTLSYWDHLWLYYLV